MFYVRLRVTLITYFETQSADGTPQLCPHICLSISVSINDLVPKWGPILKAMLGPSCAELGQVEAKMGPSWSQDGAKWSQVGDPKDDHFLDYFLDRFGSLAHAS